MECTCTPILATPMIAQAHRKLMPILINWDRWFLGYFLILSRRMIDWIQSRGSSVLR